MVRASFPLRAVTLGLQATSALVGASVQTAASAAGSLGTVASTGLSMAVIPVREGVKALSEGLPAPTLTRHSWRGKGRAWVEVRGLDGPDGAELGRLVVDAVRARSGVKSVSVNRPLSRIVVTLNNDQISLRDLCRDVDEAEKRWRASGSVDPRRSDTRPKALPGDGLLLATNALGVGATAVGMSAAVAGRVLRWPRLFAGVEAMVVAVDYQPRLRRLLEDRIGHSATDAVLSVAMVTAHVLELSPASLAVDLAMETLKAAEYQAEAQAWRRHEPALARHAEHPEVHPPSRPVPAPEGPVEQHARRSAWVQVIGTAAVGAFTRNPEMAATATLVTTPKATRTTRESFAAALGQGLADQHAVLALHPEKLRWLDRVDALLVDPRVLCTNTLRVVRVRGADEDELSPAWNRAQLLLEKKGLRVGWHPVPGLSGKGSDAVVEALIGPTHDPLASAVLAEARRAGLELISVGVDDLGELQPAFDELRPLQRASIDTALAAALTDLQQSGRTVAAVSSAAAQALSSADIGLGVMPNSDGEPPPWTADLILSDLDGVWRLLHAVPAAKSASRRGIEIATGATALGALLMVPGVRGRGPGPVTTGAAAGLLSGYLMARRVLRTPAPLPAPIHEWHAMSIEQVRKMLPPPDAEQTVEPRHGIATRAMETAQRGAELTGRPRQAVWQFAKAVRAELSDPLTPVLALGSAASAVLGSPVDAVLVGSVLTGNSMLAASQRLRAESRLNELLAQQIPPARKVTFEPDGSPVYTDVLAAQLRPGDVIEVRTHEVVPADARLIEEEDLEVDESTLTGESLPVEKQVEATPGAELAERRCMLYGGTTIVAGTAVALVTAVGADTQARRAAELVSSELPQIGLEHQLSQLTNRAFPVSVTGGLLVSGLGLLRSKGIRQAVSSGIAITVAAVPEGMPLVATLAQAASARRLTNYGALVRVPRSVEALGRIDVVCFDKTGTLSENRLRVSQVHPAESYSREDVLRCAALAAPDANGGPQVHATDRAIIEAAQSVNGSNPVAEASEVTAHLPFRSGRSFSASVFGDELTVKGAPEVVLAACNDVGPDIDNTVRQLAAEGLRVIAVARRRLTPQQAQLVAEDEDTIADLAGGELTFAGFLGLSDTPRAEAPALLAGLAEREIGIRLITGDHPITATAIARETGDVGDGGRSHQRRRVGRLVAQGSGAGGHRAGDLRPDVAGEQGAGRPDAGTRREGLRDGRRRRQRRRRDPGGDRRHRRRRPRQRFVERFGRRGAGRRPHRGAAHRDRGRPRAVAAGSGGGVGAAGRQRRRGRVRDHRRRDHRQFAAQHPATAAGEHLHRRAAGRGPGGQQAERTGADRRTRPRRAGAVARRRHPRRHHRGGGDGGVGDGRSHRTSATGVDGGAGRPGVSAAGSDSARVAHSAGRVDRGRVAGRDGNADQHPRRQPTAWLYPAGPARLGAGAGLSRGCDRRGGRRDPRIRR